MVTVVNIEKTRLGVECLIIADRTVKNEICASIVTMELLGELSFLSGDEDFNGSGLFGIRVNDKKKLRKLVNLLEKVANNYVWED